MDFNAVKRRIVHTVQRFVVNPVGRQLPVTMLETTGRKSGQPRRTAVGGRVVGDQFWMVSEHGEHSHYVLNVKADPAVRLRIDGRWRTGTAHLLPDDDAVSPVERTAHHEQRRGQAHGHRSAHHQDRPRLTMAYDEVLANRVRELTSGERGVDEKRMFGGLAFLVNGHLAVAASGKGGLMVRVPPGETDTLLAREHVEPMVMAGRETRGWLRVSDDGVKSKRQLKSWVDRGVAYAKSLPPK